MVFNNGHINEFVCVMWTHFSNFLQCIMNTNETRAHMIAWTTKVPMGITCLVDAQLLLTVIWSQSCWSFTVRALCPRHRSGYTSGLGFYFYLLSPHHFMLLALLIWITNLRSSFHEVNIQRKASFVTVHHTWKLYIFHLHAIDIELFLCIIEQRNNHFEFLSFCAVYLCALSTQKLPSILVVQLFVIAIQHTKHTHSH